MLEKILQDKQLDLKVSIVPILRLKDTIENNKSNIYVLTYKMSGKLLTDKNLNNYCGNSFAVLEAGFIQRLPSKSRIKNVSDMQGHEILTSNQHSDYFKKIFPKVNLKTKLISHPAQLVTMLEKGRFRFAYDDLYRFEMNHKQLGKIFKYHILKVGDSEVTLCTNNPKLNSIVDIIINEILKLRGSEFVQILEHKYHTTYPWPLIQKK